MTAVVVMLGRLTADHAPPSTWRWSTYFAIPLGSVAVQLVRTGLPVEVNVDREYKRGKGAETVGGAASVTTR